MKKKELRFKFALFILGQMTLEEEGAFETLLLENDGLFCKIKTLIKKYLKIGVLRYANNSVLATKLPIPKEEWEQIEKLRNLKSLQLFKKLFEETEVLEEEQVVTNTDYDVSVQKAQGKKTTSIPKGLGMAVVRTLAILAAIIAFIYLFFL